MKIKVVDDRVAVALDPWTNTSALVVPEAHRPRAIVGTVLAVGAGRRQADGQRIRPSVAVGDRVLVSTSVGEEVDVGVVGRQMVILFDHEIMAKINPAKN